MLVAVVLVTLVGSAVCFPWGLPHPVKDTPEVAAAKSAHLAALTKAQDRSWNGPGAEDDGSWKDDESWKHYDDGSWKDETRNSGQSWNAQERSWNGEPSWKEQEQSWNDVKDDGSWKDDESWKHHDDGSWTGDDSLWNQDALNRHQETHEKKWTGPIALPPGYDKHGAPLPVQDTPEVEAEKSKHFHLHARASAHA